MGEFLGQTLKDKVIEQLNLRSKFLKSKNRSGEALSILHSNTAFVALYSSVEGSGYDPETFVLEGGLAFQKDSFYRTPTGYNPSSSDGRGFTPRPGITDANIKTKGVFGALRDVEVTVKAFNKDDFNIIYDLYCRPGFSFLLEWGHTVYGLQGGISKIRQSQVAKDAFFSSGTDYDRIQDAIKEARGAAEYNYDAMVAICKNFSWTFNSDGSYDINLSLISKGEVIESIKSSFDPGTFEKDIASLVLGNVDKSERKSAVHYFCKRMEMANKTGIVAGNACKEALASTTPGFAAKFKDVAALNVWSAPGFDIKQPDSFFDKDTVFLYISLRTVCAIFNAAGIMKEGKKKAFTLRTTFGNKYFTYPQHHSINPFVCVTPNLNSENEFFHSKPAKEDLHTSITNYFKSYSDDVLSICVSNLYLYEKLDAIYDDDQESENEPGLLDIFKAILGGVNEALGGINELDLAYDEELNEWSIVDRKCRIPEKGKKPAVLDLIGLGSFAYDFKTESKITNKLASQVSIAAQATGSGTKQSVNEMLQWNRGHHDRVFPTKTEDPDGPETVEQLKAEVMAAIEFEKAYGEWKDRCKEAFDKFNGGAFEDQQYDPDLFKGLLSGHQKYQSLFVKETCQSEGIPPPGTIPIELSFTLHGIAGFKIGETFKVSENTSRVLPTVYGNDTIGFIITKLDHKIDENGWKTEVGALMYNLAKLDGKPSGALSKAGKAGGTTVQPQQNPSSTTSSQVSTEGGTDILRNQTALGTNVKYSAVKAAVQKKKYQWFEGELELNIVGVRNTSGQRAANPPGRGVLHPITNKFKDIVIVAWQEKGQTYAESYAATTVPGAGWTLATNKKFNLKGTNPNGTGTMFEKQFINQYTPGRHSSHSPKPHPSLNSVRGQTAHRDKEYRDNWIDLAVTPKGKHGTTAGLFEDGGGMQLHNSGEYGFNDPNKAVDNWSAGCQVFASADQHRRLMELVRKSQKQTKRSTFSYTLINDKDIQL